MNGFAIAWPSEVYWKLAATEKSLGVVTTKGTVGAVVPMPI